jgi:uncharacterized damage-inducible protein DinB
MEDPRPEPVLTPASERQVLEEFLEWQRATLAWKCDGVEPRGRLAERAVPPSAMSLLGIVRHMADVERSWFRRVLAGEDAPPIHYDRETNVDGDWDDVGDADPEEAFATWRAECGRAREVAAGMELGDTGAVPNDPRGRRVSLRWVLVHMIEEYARHNGHADLLRERLDGVTGE